MLDQALGWIGKLAEFLGSTIPRLLIVKRDQRALKYIHGHKLALLEPGIHFYWPLVTEIEWCHVVRQILVHQPHVVETQDGIPVVVAGVTAYHVRDPVKFLAENEDPYNVIDDVAAAAIRKVIVSRTHGLLSQALPETDTELTTATRSLLRPFGVRVEYTRLTDLAKVRPIHLTSSVPHHG